MRFIQLHRSNFIITAGVVTSFGGWMPLLVLGSITSNNAGQKFFDSHFGGGLVSFAA